MKSEVVLAGQHACILPTTGDDTKFKPTSNMVLKRHSCYPEEVSGHPLTMHIHSKNMSHQQSA